MCALTVRASPSDAGLSVRQSECVRGGERAPLMEHIVATCVAMAASGR